MASVRPVQSTPIPMMPRMAGMGVAGSSSGVGFPVNYLQKAGVYVQRIVTTTGTIHFPAGTLEFEFNRIVVDKH